MASSRLAFGWIVFGLGASLGFMACLPDPAGDFDDFGAKTESYRAAPVKDSGTVDGEAPKDPIKRAYFAACLSSLSNGRPDRTLRFYTETSFIPSSTGGTLELDLLPMKADATSFEKTSGVAPDTKFAAVPVSSNGAFAATAAVINIDGAANSISGRPITIEGVTLNGTFGTGTFCSEFAGQITAPIQQAFTATCLFVPLDNKATFTVDPTQITYQQSTAPSDAGASDAAAVDGGARTGLLTAASFVCK